MTTTACCCGSSPIPGAVATHRPLPPPPPNPIAFELEHDALRQIFSTEAVPGIAGAADAPAVAAAAAAPSKRSPRPTLTVHPPRHTTPSALVLEALIFCKASLPEVPTAVHSALIASALVAAAPIRCCARIIPALGEALSPLSFAEQCTLLRQLECATVVPRMQQQQQQQQQLSPPCCRCNNSAATTTLPRDAAIAGFGSASDAASCLLHALYEADIVEGEAFASWWADHDGTGADDDPGGAAAAAGGESDSESGSWLRAHAATFIGWVLQDEEEDDDDDSDEQGADGCEEGGSKQQLQLEHEEWGARRDGSCFDALPCASVTFCEDALVIGGSGSGSMRVPHASRHRPPTRLRVPEMRQLRRLRPDLAFQKLAGADAKERRAVAAARHALAVAMFLGGPPLLPPQNNSSPPASMRRGRNSSSNYNNNGRDLLKKRSSSPPRRRAHRSTFAH
jgi:hypothetical protein